MLTDTHAAFLENRGLDIEVATRLGVGTLNGHLAFQYSRGGKVISHKLRNANKEFKFDRKGAPLVLFNLECLESASSTPEEPLYITEGELDCVALAQLGFRYVVSVPSGASGKRSTEMIYAGTDTGFSFLWKDGQLLPELKRFKRIVLAVDADEKGQILRDELCLRLGEARCDWVSWPEGVKDANEMLQKHGGDATRAIVRNSEPMRPSASVSLADLPPRPRLMASSTWPCLDDHLKVSRSKLMVITGIPGHGKTQWALALGFRLAEQHGWGGTILTMEDSEYDVQDASLRFASRPGNLVTPGIGVSSDKSVHAIRAEWVRRHLRIRLEDRDNPQAMTIGWIKQEMEHAAHRYDHAWFLIDPWSEIQHDRSKHSFGTDYVEQTLMELKKHAKRLNLLLIIVAHPTKMPKADFSGLYEKPGMYDISGSSHWYGKADFGVIIYRPFPNKNLISVDVAKVKSQEIHGKPGEVTMQFHRDHGDFVSAVMPSKDDQQAARRARAGKPKVDEMEPPIPHPTDDYSHEEAE